MSTAVVAPPPPPRNLLASPWAQWGLLTTLWIALIGFFATQMVAVDEMSWRMALSFACLDWGPWIVLSPLVLWFVRRVHIDAANWKRTVPTHILAGLLIASGIEVGSRYAWSWGLIPHPDPRMRGGPWQQGGDPARRMPPAGEFPRFDATFGPPDGERPPGPPPDDRQPGQPFRRTFGRRMPGPPGGGQFIRARLALPIYFLLVAAAHAVVYHRRSLDRERRALSAEAQLTSARLMALQNQLHPHFLFNTLNGISSLVYISPEAADEMICALSELLRGVLDVSERKEVMLREELEFTERYLAIQRMRFADRLESKMEIQPGVENAFLPTLILQPLVENAVVHGIAAQAEKGVVTLRAERIGERLVLTVSDTGRGAGKGIQEPDGTLVFKEGIGLSNTRARLLALYGNDVHLSLKTSSSGGVVARLELPFHTQASHENPDSDRR